MITRIVIADDHRIIREGLCSLFAGEPDMEVVAEAEDGASAVQAALQHRPDVVIMDVAMPGLNGIEATRRIAAELPKTRVMALSLHSNRRFVQEILRAGACAYLLKDCAFEELTQAVRAVRTHGAYISPEITGVVIDSLRCSPLASAPNEAALLSGREREVLQLLTEGRSTREIAARLHLSTKTVSTHRYNIMDKLGLHSVAELTKFAIREGLTSV